MTDKKVYLIESPQLETAIEKLALLKTAAENIQDINIIDEETSASWTDTIPQTYDGGGKIVAFWAGNLWVLYNVSVNQQGATVYNWGKLLDEADITLLLNDKENTSNKANAITNDNKQSTTKFPTIKAVVDYLSSKLPLIVECDISYGTPQSGYIPIIFSNPTASFSDVVNAYESGRDIIVKGTTDYGTATFVLSTPLIGVAEASGVIQAFGFREAIQPEIVNVIYPSWAAYDCFIDIAFNVSQGLVGQLTCNTVNALGNIETLLAQV